MRKMIFALAAGLALFGGTSTWAQTLDFTVPANSSGSISYGGGNTDMVASGLTVSSVTGKNGTPLNNLVTLLFTTPNGALNFTTGAYTSVGSSSTVWNFGGGGPITIAGTIPVQSPSFPGDTATQLSGTIQSASVTDVSGVFNLAVAVFINTIDPTLAAYYGVPTGGWSGALHIDFSPATTNSPLTGTAFSSTSVGSGDVVTNVVPEPSTMAIAGIGALGMIGYGLRRRKALGA